MTNDNDKRKRSVRVSKKSKTGIHKRTELPGSASIPNQRFGVVGVEGGIIGPTKINIDIFTDAISSVKKEGRGLPNFIVSENDYAKAWKIAESRVGTIKLEKTKE